MAGGGCRCWRGQSCIEGFEWELEEMLTEHCKRNAPRCSARYERVIHGIDMVLQQSKISNSSPPVLRPHHQPHSRHGGKLFPRSSRYYNTHTHTRAGNEPRRHYGFLVFRSVSLSTPDAVMKSRNNHGSQNSTSLLPVLFYPSPARPPVHSRTFVLFVCEKRGFVWL